MLGTCEVFLEGEGMINFFVARVKDPNNGEKNVLKAGPNLSYKSFERQYEDSDLSVSCSGEGRLKHDKANKSIIIYSSPGPVHKLTYAILKEKFSDYKSIMWRDG